MMHSVGCCRCRVFGTPSLAVCRWEIVSVNGRNVARMMLQRGLVFMR
jgi:hypothetical protein